MRTWIYELLLEHPELQYLLFCLESSERPLEQSLPATKTSSCSPLAALPLAPSLPSSSCEGPSPLLLCCCLPLMMLCCSACVCRGCVRARCLVKHIINTKFDCLCRVGTGRRSTSSSSRKDEPAGCGRLSPSHSRCLGMDWGWGGGRVMGV